jgi:hypothetical protein
MTPDPAKNNGTENNEGPPQGPHKERGKIGVSQNLYQVFIHIRNNNPSVYENCKTNKEHNLYNQRIKGVGE